MDLGTFTIRLLDWEQMVAVRNDGSCAVVFGGGNNSLGQYYIRPGDTLIVPKRLTDGVGNLAPFSNKGLTILKWR